MRPRFRAFSRYRPRVLTLVVLFLIAAPTTLANFTSEIDDDEIAVGSKFKGVYGWPLMWHWHELALIPGACGIIDWDFSGARLAGNVALWLVMLALPTGGCEWLLRRYRPGFRWSLRTMMAAGSVVAVCCAWFAAARNRANLQDPIIAELEEHYDTAMVERPAPKWLEFIVPDRFRRRIIGIQMEHRGVLDEALAVRLARLPRLKYLCVPVESWNPEMANALTGMRQLGWLYILKRGSKDQGGQASREFLADIGKLAQLEELGLFDWEEFPHDALARLAGLRNLKSLIVFFGTNSKGSLSHLPPLPQLEAIRIGHSDVGGEELRHLAIFPRLKSLDLTQVKPDDAELADLATLKLLEELSINETFLVRQDRESLRTLKRLKKLNFASDVSSEEPEPTVIIELDGGDWLRILESDADVFSRALETLRQANPGVVIKRSVGRHDPFNVMAPFPHEHSDLYSTWLPADTRLSLTSAIRSVLDSFPLAAPSSAQTEVEMERK